MWCYLKRQQQHYLESGREVRKEGNHGNRRKWIVFPVCLILNFILYVY